MIFLGWAKTKNCFNKRWAKTVREEENNTNFQLTIARIVDSCTRFPHQGSIEFYRRLKNPHRGANGNEIFCGGIGPCPSYKVENYFNTFGKVRYVEIKKEKG